LSVTAPGNLFKNEFIGDMRFPEGLIFEDNLFYTEALLKAKRVYFYDKHLYFRRVRSDSITQSHTEKFSDWIDISKLIVELAKKYGCYEKLKDQLYKKRIVDSYYLFTHVKEEEKEEFFQKIKADFNDSREKYENDEDFKNLPFYVRLMFKSALYCENHIEYESINLRHKLRKRQTKINNKIFRLEYEIDVLKNDNTELKKEISKYKKQNNAIFNSRSWKMVKPLSQIKNVLRR
jgi:FtsZ-binding cell division protein ZapB